LQPVASGAPLCSLAAKKRNAARLRASASARVIQPRSTAIGYTDSANPTTAMLIGAPGRELSAGMPPMQSQSAAK
jgi:hypothetical protein